MRLVFLYVSYKHGFGEGLNWDTIPSTNYYASRFEEEGYSLLIDKMVEEGIVDQALCVIESKDSPGIFHCREHIQGYVIPSIEDLKDILVSGDIVWVRGGWRHWHDVLVDIQRENKHWMLMYAANTGRGKWIFWDVIFDDITGRELIDDYNRLYLDFRKPMNEDIFFLTNNSGITVYDFMIGASRIHDKKGQWRVINALVELRLMGKTPKCIMPGPMARGEKTNHIKEIVDKYDLDVNIPDNLPRHELAIIMNNTRYIIHAGSHGQGDRGIMEAMACGCIPLIAFPGYHAPWFMCSPFVHTINPDPNQMARQLDLELDFIGYPREEIVMARYRNSGIYERCLPDMDRLFSFFREHPIREERLLREKWKIKK